MKLQYGRIVHYGPGCRPAVCATDIPAPEADDEAVEDGEAPPYTGPIDLVAFDSDPQEHVTDVPHDGGDPRDGTWHMPETDEWSAARPRIPLIDG
jgi:hypothetical protein